MLKEKVAFVSGESCAVSKPPKVPFMQVRSQLNTQLFSFQQQLSLQRKSRCACNKSHVGGPLSKLTELERPLLHVGAEISLTFNAAGEQSIAA